MVAPTGMIPGQQEALTLYHQIEGDATLDADVRDTCLWALVSIGRAQWDQHHQYLETADEGVPDFAAAVNCWSMVVKWAVVSGALSKERKKRFLARLNSAPTPQATQDEMQRMIFDLVPHRDWRTGDLPPPVGAMVYHGRYGHGWNNPISHVTLHVGDNKVVSCWQAQYMQNADLRHTFEKMTMHGWLGDTMLTPIDAFGTEMLYFSVNPFWRDMKC